MCPNKFALKAKRAARQKFGSARYIGMHFVKLGKPKTRLVPTGRWLDKNGREQPYKFFWDEGKLWPIYCRNYCLYGFPDPCLNGVHWTWSQI